MSNVALKSSVLACALGVSAILTWPSVLPEATALPPADPKADARSAAIAKAQVWTPTDVASMNIKAGPAEPDAIPFRATVYCDYLDKSLDGNSPKFACKDGEGEEVKVKFGGNNGEVYAEVATTRLLWALGFGADRMYPVKVICRGCPKAFGGIARAEKDESIFDPAVIERKATAAEFPAGEGWSWTELDKVDEAAGGAPRAHRDALKLLAVFLQHTDSKPQQQRLLCLDETSKDNPACTRPLMMVNDVGLTFGRANAFNINQRGSMNLNAWSDTPVWKDDTKCVGNLPKSVTGTLNNPVIGEEGRAFLAGLLSQLTDQQITDLFEISRVSLRMRLPGSAFSGFGSVPEWVTAFKQKRDQITNRRCA